MGQLVIVRHGQSQANLNNVFAGWVNTPLTDTGRQQAKSAGLLLKKSGFTPDTVYASTLKRAIDTAKEMLDVMGIGNHPIIQNEALLERHYGKLTGMDKTKAKETFGDVDFFKYRRSFDEPPPPMDATHPPHPKPKIPPTAMAPLTRKSSPCHHPAKAPKHSAMWSSACARSGTMNYCRA